MSEVKYPKLYESTETEFQNMGFGVLSDCLSCLVTEERNGSYELEMKYPVTGIHYPDISMRRIIYTKSNDIDTEQAFRIYKITKPISGVITINAQHISYDMSGIPVAPFTASDIQSALAGLKSNAMVPCPFTLTSTRTTNALFKVSAPASIKSRMGGNEGSLLDVYGGEWHYNNFTASLENKRGSDNGVVIRYGKNLTDLKQEENCSNVYSGVVSYWTDVNGNEAHGNVVKGQGSYDFVHIFTVDCSQEFQMRPTVEQLDNYSLQYISVNNVGVPDINLTVSTEDIANGIVKDTIRLCDIATIYFPLYKVDATAMCIKTVWNVLQDRYDTYEFGNAKQTVADMIADIQAIKDVIVTYSQMDLKVNQVTKDITGNNGGYVLWHDSNNDGYPDEFLVMNTMDIATSTKVWRWNLSGLGYSNTGYNGTFRLAMTADGQFCADFITFGTIDGALIKAGSIEADRLTAGAKEAITKELSDRLTLSETDLLKYKQQVKLNDNGVEVIAGDGESVTQADGLHILTKQSDGLYHEIARFTANDSWVDNITVSNFAKIGSSRMETIQDYEFGATAKTNFTAFFWIDDV